MPLHGFYGIRNNYDSVHFDEHKITDAFAVFSGGDHSGDQRTGLSLSSVIITLVGVTVDYKTILLSSTDSIDSRNTSWYKEGSLLL